MAQVAAVGSKPIEARGYAHPEVLVSTQWVADHLNDPRVRIVEADEDVTLFDRGHVPGAVKLDWLAELNDPLVRDYVDRERFEGLMRAKGIANDTTVILYGDKNNWWATYTFWVFKLFGHDDVRVMDGGRKKWEDEGREMSAERPTYPATAYRAKERDDRKIRAFKDEVLEHMQSRRPLVDVRSPDEFSGKKLHLPEYPQEGCLRGGHIPGAKNVPWARAVNPDTSEFKTADELRAIYEAEQGLESDDEIIAYCRIGERSSHTWFVLTHLLGYPKVRNYDGSWTEWATWCRPRSSADQGRGRAGTVDGGLIALLGSGPQVEARDV